MDEQIARNVRVTFGDRDVTAVVNAGAHLYTWMIDGRAGEFMEAWIKQRGLSSVLTPEQKRELAKDLTDAIMESLKDKTK